MKNKKIKKEMNIAQAIEENENTTKVLFESGIGCLGCIFANSETLEEGLISHGLNKKEIDSIIKKINSNQ